MADNLVGKVIDGYEILEERGRGSFATVFKAKPVGLKNTIVALKVAHPGKEDRLKAEAAVYDVLQQHHNILDIFGVHFSSEINYVVMKYMPETVRDVLNKSGRYTSAEKVLNIAKQVADALDFMHQKGFVHKDIKPEAIMLDGDHVELVDFNLAKIITEEKAITKQEAEALRDSLESITDPKLSLRGGTIGYMSPEQEMGKDVDGRSDLFNLGKVIYEMLTGKRPSANYKKPSELVNAPLWIDALVDKALADDPNHRFQTAGDMGQFIDDGLAGKLDAVLQKKSKLFSKENIASFALKTLGYTALCTIGLPLLPAYLLGRNADWNDNGHDDLVPASIMAGLAGIVLGYIVFPAITLNNHYDTAFKNELKQANLTGKIAYHKEKMIGVFDAQDLMAKDRKEKYLYPKTEKISSLMWDADGQSLYFIGNEGETAFLYNLTIDGVQTSVADLTSSDLKRGALCGVGTSKDGKKLIYLQQNGTISAIGPDGLKTDVACYSPEMIDAQKISPDGRFEFAREGNTMQVRPHPNDTFSNFDIVKAEEGVWHLDKPDAP